VEEWFYPLKMIENHVVGSIEILFLNGSAGILGIDRNFQVVRGIFTHPDINPSSCGNVEVVSSSLSISTSGACGGSKGDIDDSQKGRGGVPKWRVRHFGRVLVRL
jgi:hypothetical protein